MSTIPLTHSISPVFPSACLCQYARVFVYLYACILFYLFHYLSDLFLSVSAYLEVLLRHSMLMGNLAVFNRDPEEFFHHNEKHICQTPSGWDKTTARAMETCRTYCSKKANSWRWYDDLFYVDKKEVPLVDYLPKGETDWNLLYNPAEAILR